MHDTYVLDIFYKNSPKPRKIREGMKKRHENTKITIEYHKISKKENKQRLQKTMQNETKCIQRF